MTKSKDYEQVLKRIYGFNEDLFRMSQAVCDVTLQHLEAFRRIKEGQFPGGIILEDDVVLNEDISGSFCEALAEALNRLGNADLFFFGDGNPETKYQLAGLSKIERFLARKLNDGLFLKKNGQSNYSDSYFISKKFCADIFDSSDAFCMPIDWELSFFPGLFRKEFIGC